MMESYLLAALVESIEENLQDQLAILGSQAGLHCTARLISGLSAPAVAQRIQKKGFVIRELSEYELAKTIPEERSNGLIFGFACAPPDDIVKAVQGIRSCFR